MVTMEWGEFVYAPPAARVDDLIVPPEDEAHHLFRVRRIAAGDEVYVTDGEGMVYGCLVLPDHSLKILHELPFFGEPVRPILLCAAVLKGDSNREIIDAATQLGASTIILFHGQRSEGRLREDKLVKLRRITVTAIKQCGRARLPQIVLKNSLEAALASIPAGCMKFLAHPFEDMREIGTMPAATAADSSMVIVGPEGGFTDAEVDVALKAGCRPLILARRRLRAETAVAAGLTFLLTRRGEFQAP
ncbi:MAG TPA: RsmE family RNA methyltransferase [bacterium]|jgi:16S rRNA (uracil1498-N3)-methyltransferase